MPTDDFVSVPKKKPGRPRIYPDAKVRRREYMQAYRKKQKDQAKEKADGIDRSGDREVIDGDSAETSAAVETTASDSPSDWTAIG